MSEQVDLHLTEGITGVAVVVPANDEEVLLPSCLTALQRAVAVLRRAEPLVRVEVVVVLDACTDGTTEVAAHSGVHVTTINERCVGAARAAGAATVRALLGVGVERGASQVWLACTDADSVVPPDWLTDQVTSAAGGADLVLGRVRPDPDDLDDASRREWSRRHRSTDPASHVHGANLGVRWTAFEAAGGFRPVFEHEDVLLAEGVLARGGRVAPGREVLTSGRRSGRVAGGFSGYLQDLTTKLAL